MNLIRFDPAAKLNLVFWGDPQISPVETGRVQRFTAACNAVRDAQGRADAVLIAGDIAEFGREAEYTAVAGCLKAAAGNADAIVCCTGNHDVRIRPYKSQLRRFRAFLCDVPKAPMCPYDRYYFSTEIGGYPLIVMGADRNSFESAYIGKTQLSFVEAELQKAQAEGKPAFVLNHQPLNRTNGLPVTWEGRGSWRGGVGMQSQKLRDILTSHGHVFYLTGHLHYGVSGFSVENSGRLHMLAAPSVGCANHGPNGVLGQGFVLSLYEDKLVGTAYDFVNAAPLSPAVPNASFEIRLN